MAFRPRRQQYKTVDELSQDFLALIDYLNKVLVTTTGAPNPAAGQNGTLTISWDGTTMYIYGTAGQGQSKITKKVQLT